jgi:aspartate dehydrogenase
MSTEPLRLAFIGWGAIARTTAGMLGDAIDVVAVAVRDATSTRPDLPPGARVITDPASLAATRPDVVAEAAGRESVGSWGLAALDAGADVIVSSVSAFADTGVLDSLRAAAERNHAQVQIQPGALAGVDALAAARHMGIDAVQHRIIKPPRAWQGTPAEDLCDLDGLAEPVSFFKGNAAETAAAFPKNANVAMTTALAGIGPDATAITLVADPTATTNRHEITAYGPFGRLDVGVSNNPLPENPKTSAMAALSLVRAIENRITPIAI